MSFAVADRDLVCAKVEQNDSTNLANVSFFGAQAVMPCANGCGTRSSNLGACAPAGC